MTYFQQMSSHCGFCVYYYAKLTPNYGILHVFGAVKSGDDEFRAVEIPPKFLCRHAADQTQIQNRFACELGSSYNCDQKLAAPVSHTLYLAKLVQCPICSSYIDTNVIAVHHLSHGP